MVRQFNLINEKNQQFSLMDMYNYCLFTDPQGFGYEYNTRYEQVGDIFIHGVRTVEQGNIYGVVNFMNYDNYKKFVDFVESSKSLKFAYKIPLKNEIIEYFRDIEIAKLGKSEIKPNGIISEDITFNCLGLWYQDKETIYDIGEMGEVEMQWDFRWDTRFGDYKSRSIVFENDGHIEAPLKLEMSGFLVKPKIIIKIDNEIIANLSFDFNLNVGEKILYSSVDNNLYLEKQNIDGTIESLFKHEYIDLKNNNIFKVPKGISEIVLSADNNILSAKINIYKQYKVV